jgi:hypothetical protein
VGLVGLLPGHAVTKPALLEWFRDETEARVINLNATPDGIALYRSVGFTAPRFAALHLILAEPRP